MNTDVASDSMSGVLRRMFLALMADMKLYMRQLLQA